MTYLKLKHVFTMFWWSLVSPYKVIAMKYFEKKGMVDLFAFRKVKNLSKKEYKQLNINIDEL